MRVENWQGYEIRFVEKDGEYWAILKDICDALGLKTFKVSQRLDPDMLMRVPVEGIRKRPSKYREENYDIPSKYTETSKESSNTFWMLAVNELGIYETIFASRKLEARQFRHWTAKVLRRLRSEVGLKSYEAMRMLDQDVQGDIDHFLDTLFYDEEDGQLYISRTVQGGDVEQVLYDTEGLDGDIL